MRVRMENREDPDQTSSEQTASSSSLVWVCTVYLGLFDRQLMFDKSVKLKIINLIKAKQSKKIEQKI